MNSFYSKTVGVSQSDINAGQPQPPHHVYLLLKVSSSTRPTVRELAELSDVKKRAFIGTTTLPADRALLMSIWVWWVQE